MPHAIINFKGKRKMKPESKLANQILEFLLKGYGLSVNECQGYFGTTELRHYIAQLRKQGYNISDKKIKYVGNRGQKKWYKRYWIDLSKFVPLEDLKIGSK